MIHCLVNLTVRWSNIMVTKEQAVTANEFIHTLVCGKVERWRRNGKTQVWKTRPNEFKVPVKHGLYSYGYITQDNAHLFNIVGD